MYGGLRRRRARRAIAGALALVLAAGIGCAQKPVTPAPLPAPPPNYPDEVYRLAPGDVLDVKFPYNAELNETVTVRPDGAITLQRVGDVRAAGRSPEELAKAVAERFASVVPHPEASILVRDFTLQQVYVGGEVKDPGTVSLRGPVTSLQAILSRGGPKTTAFMSHVVLLRYVGPDQATVQEVDLDGVLDGETNDFVLRPYDVVFVPMTPIAIVGEYVEQYINKIVPKSVTFPYNLNTRVTIGSGD